jgi:hypothetical protein
MHLTLEKLVVGDEATAVRERQAKTLCPERILKPKRPRSAKFGNNHIQIRGVLSSLSKKKVKIMGHLRQLVLNIVRFNRATKECLMVSMYGEQSDWYQNIQAHPAAPS